MVANGDLSRWTTCVRCARDQRLLGVHDRPRCDGAARSVPAAAGVADATRSSATRCAELLLRLRRADARRRCRRHAVLGRLKQWLRMGAPQREDLSEWFEVIKRLPSLAQAEQALG